jgi:hypothetical protein
MSGCGCRMQLFLPLLKLIFLSIIHVFMWWWCSLLGVAASCQAGTKYANIRHQRVQALCLITFGCVKFVWACLGLVNDVSPQFLIFVSSDNRNFGNSGVALQ